MMLNPRRRTRVLLVTFGLILLAVILALIAPEEKMLGSYIKLIYIHAAVTWVGLISFIITGLLAVFYFAGYALPRSSKISMHKNNALNWSSAVQTNSVIFWTTSVVLGSFAASLTWGGNWWSEPRLQVAIIILLIAIAVFILRTLIEDKPLQAVLNLSLPVSAFILLAKTGKLVHPNNAFAKSDSLGIKLSAGIITLLFIAVAINFARLFVEKLKSRETQAEATS